MEFIARDMGAIGILVSAPMGGRLNELMPNIGYSHTNEVFFKATFNDMRLQREQFKNVR
jgi:hypothetical protein